MSFFFRYIEDEYIDNLIGYKYSGGDKSVLYRFVINPFCNWFVNYLPKWLAPNVITVSGFFFNLFNLILTCIYSGMKGGDPIPSWVCIVCAISYTTYIIFDYTDGKQARRLNASSPLGLLFDHGTDACTTFYATIVTGCIIYYSNIHQYLLLYFPLSFTFFINTWEEYYVGELVLPEVNGVAEGTLLIDIFYIISAIYGSDFYSKEITFFKGTIIKVNVILGIVTCIGGFLFCCKSVLGVLKKVKKEKLGTAFKDAFIYFLFAITLACLSFLDEGVYIKEYPKFIILTFGFQFAKMLGMLQLAHVTNSSYQAYKFVFLFPLFILLIHSIIYYYNKYQLFGSIDNIIVFCFVWNFLSWAHFVYFCSDQICDILNIKRFSLGKRDQSRPSYEEIKSKVSISE